MPLSSFMQMLEGKTNATPGKRRRSKRVARGTGRSGEEVIEQEPKRLLESLIRNNRLSQSTINGWRSREDATRGIVAALKRDNSLNNLYDSLPHPKDVSPLVDAAWKVSITTEPAPAPAPVRQTQKEITYIEVHASTRQKSYIRTKPRTWTTADDRMLGEAYPKTPNATIAAFFGRTISSIESRSHRLGLKKASRTL